MPSDPAQRPENIALPLPKGLAGAAVKMAVTKMIEHGWLQEVDASSSRGEPLWYETGDGHGNTLVVTDAGLLAIGIEPVAKQTVAAIRALSAVAPAPKQPTPARGDETGAADRVATAARRGHNGRDRSGNELVGTYRQRRDVGCLGQEARAGCDLGQGGRQGAGVSDRPTGLVFSQHGFSGN